jgi:hypothetical protein
MKTLKAIWPWLLFMFLSGALLEIGVKTASYLWPDEDRESTITVIHKWDHERKAE